MKIQLTLEQAYARASEGLRQKMEYSVRLLQKADRLTTGTEADQFNAIIRQYFGQSVTIHLARQGR